MKHNHKEKNKNTFNSGFEVFVGGTIKLLQLNDPHDTHLTCASVDAFASHRPVFTANFVALIFIEVIITIVIYVILVFIIIIIDIINYFMYCSFVCFFCSIYCKHVSYIHREVAIDKQLSWKS